VNTSAPAVLPLALLGACAASPLAASPPVTAMLAGHTHGAQVAAFGYAPVRPWGSGRYVAGWYRDAWPHLYVSRGIGTSVLPFRPGSPPEVAVFDWHLAG